MRDRNTAMALGINGIYRVMLLWALVLVDQVVKLIIQFNFFHSDKMLIWEFLRFKPLKNIQLSWVNDLFNLGLGLMPQVTVNIFALLLVYFVYRFYISKRRESTWGFAAYTLLMAGAVCSLIDKVFWGGSLDYILYTGILGGYTFDLKDCYITGFELMLAIGLIMNTVRDREFMKFLNAIKFREITSFVRSDIGNKVSWIKTAASRRSTRE